MDRRKFLNIVGCCGCSYIINSCASVPITDRKQLNLIPEAKLNAQAAEIYEKVKKKEKLINDGRNLKEIKEVKDVDLDLVWDPPWDKSMMSEAAKLELNL